MTTNPPVLLEAITQAEAPALRHLFQLYAHDFSEQVPLELKPSGLFDVPLSDEWWSSSAHFPFFIRASGTKQLLGFALVRSGSRVTGAPGVMDVAEFFVARGARARGVGCSAAHALFAKFPGAWEIRVRRTNPLALRFWLRVVETWSGRAVTPEPVVLAGVDWLLLRLPAPTAD